MPKLLALCRIQYFAVLPFLVVLCLAGCQGDEPAQSEESVGITASNLRTVRLQSLELSPQTLRLSKGHTQELSLRAKFSDGTTQDVTTAASWLVYDVLGTDVGAISPGSLQAKNAGTARILARYEGRLASAAVRVTELPQVCSADGWCWQNPSPQGNRMQHIWVADEKNAWAVGNGGTILKWDGTAWLAQSSGTTMDLRGVWGSDTSNVWAVGGTGTILKWNGAVWSYQPSGIWQDLYGVWGTDANHVWAVGGQGSFDSQILKWDGTSWSRQPHDDTGWLYGIWGTDANHVWAVGSYGAILKWNGTTWSTQSSGTGKWLFGVSGSDANNVWAVGETGTIVKWNGAAWSPQTSGVKKDLWNVWGSDANHVWAVGDYGAILNGDYDPLIRTYTDPRMEMSCQLPACPT